MKNRVNTLPSEIKRTDLTFVQTVTTCEYYKYVLRNLRPNESLVLTYPDQASLERGHVAICRAATIMWGRGRIKTYSNIQDCTVHLWFTPDQPLPELEPLEQIEVPLEKLPTYSPTVLKGTDHVE